MIVIGLTGSIGMGKSTVAGIFEKLGVPAHDADAAVHALLSPKGRGYKAVVCAFPYFEYPGLYGWPNRSGVRLLDRTALGGLVFHNPRERRKLENILHPLVREDQNSFIARQRRMGRSAVLLDIPLLFETGAEHAVDCTIAVTAPYDIQKSRVLARPNMTEEKFRSILAAQMPDRDKCRRADYIIHTGLGLAHTMRDARAALADIRKKTALKTPAPQSCGKMRRDFTRSRKTAAFLRNAARPGHHSSCEKGFDSYDP